MKLAFLIVALTLALTPSAPAQPATLAAGAGTVAAAAVDTAAAPGDTADPTLTRRRNNDTPETAAVPGPSTYMLLALGLFGMGLVSRRRRAD